MLIDHSKFKNFKISNAQDAFEIIQSIRQGMHLFEIEKEYLYSCGLTRSNRIKFIEIISIGSLHSTVAEIREIYRVSIVQGASSIILFHNHPSGNLNPSESDIKLTNKVKAAGKIIGIELFDHIIISDKGFYSFANEGML